MEINDGLPSPLQRRDSHYLWKRCLIHLSTIRRSSGHQKQVEGFVACMQDDIEICTNTRLSHYRSKQICPQCEGKRLNPVALAVRFQNKNIHELSTEDIGSLFAFFSSLQLRPNQQLVGGPIVRQLLHRLSFLVQVGLTYLSLDRSATTLSGGESQRIRLAASSGVWITRRDLYIGRTQHRSSLQRPTQHLPS